MKYLTVREVAERTGLTTKAVKRRCENGTIQYECEGKGHPRKIPESEVERIVQSLAAKGIRKENKKVEVKDNEATVVSSDYDLSNPALLLRERGLDPNDWDITHLKVNEWDGPQGEPLKQLTVNVRKRLTKLLPTPGVTPNDWVAPPKKDLQPSEKKLVVFVGDQQAPHHDPDLHRIFCDWLSANQPQEGVLTGDTVDFPDVSRHPANPEWDHGVQSCVNAGYAILKDYVQASPNTRWTKLMGNHDERIRNKLLQQVSNLYDLRVADVDGQDPEPPVWCVSHLLRLKQLGIKFAEPNGGYTHAQVNVSKHLAARHGWVARKGSGASALTTLEQLGYSVVVGHTHRQSLVHKTTHDIDGSIQTLAAAETGCMCKIKDGLGYAVAPDWQNGFATATVWKDGTFKLDLATYANNVLRWRDSKYE